MRERSRGRQSCEIIRNVACDAVTDRKIGKMPDKEEEEGEKQSLAKLCCLLDSLMIQSIMREIYFFDIFFYF